MMNTLSAAVAVRLPMDIDPTPDAPPGADVFETVINWVMWGAIAMGAIGLIVSVILIFAGVLDGRSSQGIRAFLIVCVGLVLLGVVGQIISALT
ncbi:hypothetical protein EEW87_17535 (plasmid) [Janibacter melonis]|uniref:Conjugal transfer protein TrbC n=1 Tax=Janibacter melonis TaxID=262209 RepID=A0A650GES3_9MICO|nr:hypothetical protein [Janibacter melonis]QGX08807.1 hypothetical protein EEW87_17535 [Janibacter melonis]